MRVIQVDMPDPYSIVGPTFQKLYHFQCLFYSCEKLSYMIAFAVENSDPLKHHRILSWAVPSVLEGQKSLMISEGSSRKYWSTNLLQNWCASVTPGDLRDVLTTSFKVSMLKLNSDFLLLETV